MKPYDFPIIIGRQYGSGGRKIGKMLAERLAIRYYDKEILAEAAAAMGYQKEVFDKADEKAPSFLSSLTGMFSYLGTPAGYDCGSLTTEHLYNAQSHIIQELASAEPAVFVGRTADYILRDVPNMISIFIHAPLCERAERILARGECKTIEQAIEIAKRKDRQREEYYNSFTGKKWGYASNYDLCINHSHLSDDDIIKIIIEYINTYIKI
jgi:hypothetical protein